MSSSSTPIHNQHPPFGNNTNQTPLFNPSRIQGPSSNSTPSRSSKKRTANSTRTTPRAAVEEEFTPLMQDAQARGKDPYRPGRRKERLEDSSDSDMEWYADERFNVFGFDNYERTQQRRGAALILDNPELIMMHALARGDSIPGTRHYFRKMICGYLDPNEVYQKPGMPQDKDNESRSDRTGKSSTKKSRRSGAGMET